MLSGETRQTNCNNQDFNREVLNDTFIKVLHLSLCWSFKAYFCHSVGMDRQAEFTS